MQTDTIALILQAASCFMMTGVVWVMQLTHYPSFADIRNSKFVEFHQRHSKALGLIAGPLMLIELISALWLARSLNPLATLNAAGTLGLWGITFLVSVPAHNQLARGFDSTTWVRLVNTNWLRTVLWSVRSVTIFIWCITSLTAKS